MRRWAASLAAAAALLGACAGAQHGPQRSPYDLVLPTTRGTRFDFASLQGHPALVTFFATWCLPCMLQAPSFAALQKRYGAAGFQVVAVGMDLEGLKVLRPYAEVSALPYPVLLATQEVRDGETPYGRISELPTSYLIDRKGKIEAAWAGAVDPASLEKLVERLTR